MPLAKRGARGRPLASKFIGWTRVHDRCVDTLSLLSGHECQVRVVHVTSFQEVSTVMVLTQNINTLRTSGSSDLHPTH